MKELSTTYLRLVDIKSVRKIISEAIENAYALLGVKRSASDEEVNRAYDARAKALVGKRDFDSQLMSVRLRSARTALLDPGRRAALDRHLSGEPPLPVSRPAEPPTAGQTPMRRRADVVGQPPRGKEQAPADEPRRYFVSGDEFWWIEAQGKTVTVGRGRVGTPGRVRSSILQTPGNAKSRTKSLVNFMTLKGFAEDVAPEAGSEGAPSYEPSAEGAPMPGAPRGVAAPRPRGPEKKTYKVYGNGPPGDRKGAPAHTGFKGKFYKAAWDTKFKPNSSAAVELDDDGTLKVTDPESGHSQKWSKANESIEDWADSVLFETEMPTKLSV